jgi:hypothetical protein
MPSWDAPALGPQSDSSNAINADSERMVELASPHRDAWLGRQVAPGCLTQPPADESGARDRPAGAAPGRAVAQQFKELSV